MNKIFDEIELYLYRNLEIKPQWIRIMMFNENYGKEHYEENHKQIGIAVSYDNKKYRNAVRVNAHDFETLNEDIMKDIVIKFNKWIERKYEKESN